MAATNRLPSSIGAIEWEADVVLLVAVENEFTEIVDWIERLAQADELRVHKVASCELGLPSHDVEFATPGGLVVRYHIVKLPFPSMGSDAATYITTRVIMEYKPIAVCMVGICAGDPAQTRYRDVVVASSTVRHDIGTLRVMASWASRFLHWAGANAVHLDHRAHRTVYDGPQIFSLADLIELTKALPREPSSHARILLGTFATGNQIIKVPGVFEYLRRANVESKVGDESERRLLALDMEAHSVAYAAQQSGTGWLIVKGVADHADARKSNEHHSQALNNALMVAQWLIPRVVERGFKKLASTASAKQQLAVAVKAYGRGDFESAIRAIEAAYGAGARSVKARSLYVKCQMRKGEYDAAEHTLREYRKRDWFNDNLTRELLAEVNWRRGEIREMQQLLEELAPSSAQLAYLKALALLFDSPRSMTTAERAGTLKDAKDLLEQAIESAELSQRFYLEANHYFTCLLLEREGKLPAADRQASPERSIRTLDMSIAANPRRGLLYIYMLMILALADDHARFDEFRKAHLHSNLDIAADNIDMIIRRIAMIHPEGSVASDRYISGLCHFAAANNTIGRAVRMDTRGFLARAGRPRSV